MERTGNAICPQVEAAFGLLAKKWTALIIFSLSAGEAHFCELKSAIPDLSSRLLALRMRELEEAGLASRRVSEAAPVRVEYGLTPKGRGLAALLEGIAAWAKAERKEG